MAIEIWESRLSFVWTETGLGLLTAPGDAPFLFLSNFHGYKRRFNEIARGVEHGDPLQLYLPWPGPAGQLFWTYYLSGQPPGRVKVDQAWKRLVPFRAQAPVKLEVGGLLDRARVEGFFYPHCVGLIVTVNYRARLALDQAIEGAFNLRRGKLLRATWAEGGTQELTLDQFADEALTRLRAAALGAGASTGTRSTIPFSVVTVIQGNGVGADAPTPAGDVVHRALEALCNWRPTYRHDELPPLDQGCLAIRTAPSSHVLYGSRRGRVVWFPGLFTLRRDEIRSLSCYHRNLVLASLQTESLCALVRETAQYLETGQPLAPVHWECAQNAAQILPLLQTGDRSIYRSSSMQKQIEQNQVIEDLTKVRHFFGLPFVPNLGPS